MLNADRTTERVPAKVYLVGGGIASLTAAVFMIRDGNIPVCDITVLEQLGEIGGSLDGSGTPESGYVLRGGRMIEGKYLCTFDLFSSIPTLDGSKTVTREIVDWNDTSKTSSRSRLFRNGRGLCCRPRRRKASGIRLSFGSLEPDRDFRCRGTGAGGMKIRLCRPRTALTSAKKTMGRPANPGDQCQRTESSNQAAFRQQERQQKPGHRGHRHIFVFDRIEFLLRWNFHDISLQNGIATSADGPNHLKLLILHFLASMD
jgi:hypothetical protein